MTERPILFSAPMIRAILDGRKSQTRRVVKPQPELTHHHDADRYIWKGISVSSGDTPNIYCPYGIPGDRLWVRETWRYDDWTEDGEPSIRYRADNSLSEPLTVPEELSDKINDVWAELSVDFKRKGRACDEEWRPSIFMYRFMSRFLLELTGVRVERLQEISNADIRAEGMAVFGCVTHRLNAEQVWDSINAKRGHSWVSNPWVWVLTFKGLS